MHKPDYKNGYCVTCGESFRTTTKLARHIQKWNIKFRSLILSR